MTTNSKQCGFTMIELIIVILVIGILVAMGTFGLKQSIDGYRLAQSSSESTQKAQMALARIVNEISHMTYSTTLGRYNISSGSATSLSYTANFGGSDENNTIDQSGNLARLNTLTLTDNVITNGLQFTYYNGSGSTVSATDTTMRLLGITLTIQVISGASGTNRTFSARVALPQ